MLVVKNPPANPGGVGSILGSGRSPGGGHGNPLQYSCLEKPMDREAWQAADHRAAKSPTRLRCLSTQAYKGVSGNLRITILKDKISSF